MFQFPVLLFTDDCTFSFNLTIDPLKEFPDGAANIETVAASEMTYVTYQRESRTDVTTHYTATEIFEFAFDAPCKCLFIVAGHVALFVFT